MSHPSAGAGSTWLRRYRPVASPRLRLVCLPHAGGAPSFFRPWASLAPPDVEVVAVCYPGRQDRLAEPCLETMAELVDQLEAALLPLAGDPIALFGHSMGSAVAYETTLRLERIHGVQPVALFVSGRAAPHRARPTGLHLRDEETLLRGAAELGGLDPVVLEEPALRELVLPALRSDFRLIESYIPDATAQVRAPIAAYHGVQDSRSTVDEVREWAALTERDFDLRLFPGGHFYLVDAETQLVDDICRRLRAASV